MSAAGPTRKETNIQQVIAALREHCPAHAQDIEARTCLEPREVVEALDALIWEDDAQETMEGYALWPDK